MANGVSGTRGTSSFQSESGFTKFAALSPDAQAAAIMEAKSARVPLYLNGNSDLQRLLYNQNIVGLPEVISDDELDKVNGIEIYRTVNEAVDPNRGINLTAPAIAAQMMWGSQTYVASGTMAFHGEGLYFANDRTDSENYGYTRGDLQKTCVIRAKIKPGTKIISERKLVRECNKEIKNGTALGKALIGATDKRSLYAVSKGYKVIYDDYNYYDVIDRTCLAISDTVTAKSEK